MQTSLDPTAKLILVTKDFGPEPEPKEIILPTPYSTTKNPTLVLDINVGDVKDIENIPPIYVKTPGKYIALRKRKLTFGNYDRSVFDEARDKTNPYHKIGRSVFMDRAGVKLANIDALYKLTGHLGAFMNYTTPETLTFCDLAGAPGAFTQYIQWRITQSIGYGISLVSKDSSIPTWNLKLLDQSRFFPFDGDDGTGNLFTEWKSFVNRVLRDQGTGVNLVVADGGFDVEKEKAFDRQEFLTFRLIMIQFLTGVKVLREGGNMVIKVFDTVTELSAQLLYLASLCFEKISLFKPISSRPANNEKYLICQGKKKGTQKYEYILEKANQSYNQDEVVINLLKDPLPNDFTNWLTEINTLLMKNQEEAVNWIFDQLEGKKVIIPQVNDNYALVLWNIPGNPIVKRSKIKIPGSGHTLPTLFVRNNS